MAYRRVIRNRAQCPNCKDIIESKYRHDFVSCSCGNIAVDGGHDYAKRSWKDVEPIELSEFEEVEEE